MSSKAFEQFASSAGGPIGVAIAVLGVVGTIYVIWGDDIKKALSAAGEAVNPVSDKNLAYRGVNEIGAAITGEPDYSLGVAIYEFFHPFEEDYSKTPPYVPRTTAVKEEAAWYERLLGK